VEAHACILYMPDKVTWMKLKDASMDGGREAAVKLISLEAQILSSILGRSVYEPHTRAQIIPNSAVYPIRQTRRLLRGTLSKVERY
jgi:hypothetical protein